MGYILGLSAYYHDSAVALIANGEIISAVQEERFSRKKHDSRFPENAVKYCLKSNNLDLRDIKNIIYYEKPLLTFERLLETYLAVAPRGGRSFIAAMQVWLKILSIELSLIIYNNNKNFYYMDYVYYIIDIMKNYFRIPKYLIIQNV